MSGEVVEPNAQVEAHTPQTTVAPVIDDREKPITAVVKSSEVVERQDSEDLDEEIEYSEDDDDDDDFAEFDGSVDIDDSCSSD